MTISFLKTTASTSQNLLRNTTPTTARDPNRQPQTNAAAGRSTGAARRFLNVLMNSLSAWAV